MSMPRMFPWLLMLAVSIACASAHADEEADHQSLRELKTLFEQAASTNNLDLLKPHLHEPFTIVTFTDREFTDFETFKQQWNETRDKIVGDGSYTVTLLPERSEVYGDVAVARGNSENVLVTAAGDRYEFASHWTAVCRKVDGQWRLVRAHYSLDPFGNPMIKSQVKRLVTSTLLLSAAVGLLVGGLAVWIFLRRRQRRAVPSSG